MRLTYWHAASQTIEVHDRLRILTDPWFGYGDGRGGGNYEGSWGSSVPLPDLPQLLDYIGPVELIYLSHLHPDHYAPAFLHAYLDRYPDAGTLLLTPDEPLFCRALTRDGLAERVVHQSPLSWSDGTQAIVVRSRVDPIDSALAVRHGDQAIVHLNDCLWDDTQVAVLQQFTAGRQVTACLPFQGAGEWPQTYALTAEDMAAATRAKREQFRRLFCRYVDALQPTRAVPIAGDSQYVGPLAGLNPLRGLPTPQEAALWRLQGHAMLLGQQVDLDTDKVHDVIIPREAGPLWVRDPPPFDGYRYERDPRHTDPARLRPLATQAARSLLTRAPRKLDQPFWLCVGTAEECLVAIDCSGEDGYMGARPWRAVETLRPREEMVLDPRHLEFLLAGQYSWNLALGGAHVRSRREPMNDYRAPLYHDLINYLRVP